MAARNRKGQQAPDAKSDQQVPDTNSGEQAADTKGGEGGDQENAAQIDARALRIRSRTRQVFRRCGRAFSPAWAEYPVSDFTAAEIETLLAESSLQVEVIGE